MRKVLRFRILSLRAVGLALVVSLSLAGAKWATTHAAGLTPAQTSPASCPPVIKIVSSPSPGSAGNELEAIATISASNIWAVGEFTNTGGFGQALIEHWNGSSWSVVSSPGSGDELFGIAAVSASDIWAAGDFQNTGGVEQTLIERWNGSSWSVVSNPSPGSSYNELQGIWVVSASDLWAAGDFANSGGLGNTLFERWNGSGWSVVSSPSPGSGFNRLLGVATVNGNLWAVGGFNNTGGPEQTLIEHGCA